MKERKRQDPASWSLQCKSSNNYIVYKASFLNNAAMKEIYVTVKCNLVGGVSNSST
jgi:hypothetical protein